MFKRLRQFFQHYWQFGVALVGFIIALGLQLGGVSSAAHIILTITSIILLLPLVFGMWRDIRHGTYGIDILAATAIITALIMQEYWAAIIVVLMLTGGEALEDYAGHRAQAELDTLLSHAPAKARLIKAHGKIVEVAASTIRVGDKVLVRPGEVVPVDGHILEGDTSFDESSLTGESVPQVKTKQEMVLSGSISIEGAVTIRAARTANDSQYQQIIKLVRTAAASQAPFVRLADKYSIPFTMISFAIAGGAWLVSGESIRFLEVLVVATPCPLILAAPIAFVSGMSRAAKHGIIVKTGSALEKLADAKTIAFDKTGTLTEGKLAVESVLTFNGFGADEVLRLAASVEQNSSHVLAHAIVTEANNRKLKLAKIRSIKEVPGQGIQATVNGTHVLAGRQSLLEQSDVDISKIAKAATQTAVYIAINGRLAGIINLRDTVRPESKQTITKLKDLGLNHIMMITGDNARTAKTIAGKVGINEVVAGVLPGEKLLAIEKIRHQPVAFVGDGVNDAPVLTASDVGIALGARGSTVASESADMVIMLDDVSRVARAVEIARRTLQIAKQSIFIGIGISIVLMMIFATGRFTAVQGALIQELVDVIVIVNALRAHGSFRKKA